MSPLVEVADSNSLNKPATVNAINFGYKYINEIVSDVLRIYIYIDRSNFKLTVNKVKSTENDWGSCCVLGHSANVDTTAKRPTFKWRILEASSLLTIRRKLRLNFQNECNLKV